MNKAKLIRECDRQVEHSYDNIMNHLKEENMSLDCAERPIVGLIERFYTELSGFYVQLAMQMPANACMGNQLNEFYKYEILKMNVMMRGAELILDPLLEEAAEKLEGKQEEMNQILYPDEPQLPDNEEEFKEQFEKIMGPGADRFYSLSMEACDFCKEQML